MRQQFPGYYRPSDEALKGMWDKGVFSFDANVLLNLYRYTPDTRDRLLEILEKLGARAWLTHQAALEFHKNRLEVITTQRNAYDDIKDSIVKKNLASLLGQIRQQYSKHSAIGIGPLEAIVTEAETKLVTAITQAQEEHPDLMTEDPILDRITALFEDKVGKSYSKPDLAAKYKDAENRFKYKIPPGFEDSKKPEPDKYGDVLVWFQLMDHAKSEQKPVIFVTDDKKDDWWRSHKGQTVGPRPELAQEMQDAASVAFYMYTPERFMTYAEQYLGLPRRTEIIAEVRQLSEQDRVGQVIRRDQNHSQNYVTSVSDWSDYTWTEFWSWARKHGFTDRRSLERALGKPLAMNNPGDLRHQIESQSQLIGLPALEWSQFWKWGRGELEGHGVYSEADLEVWLGTELSELPPWKLQQKLIDEFGFVPF